MSVTRRTIVVFHLVLCIATLHLLGALARPLPSWAAEPPTAPQPSWAEVPEYRIGLGDRVEVQVWKEPELSKLQAVRIDGRISLPLIGDIEVIGKSIPELKGLLEKRFGEVVSEPAISVLLTENRSWRYYVLGQIRTPGEFAIDFPMTLLQVLARSGGFLEWAKTDSIVILRREGGQERIIHFDYQALQRGEKLAQNIMIAAGDTIIIP